MRTSPILEAGLAIEVCKHKLPQYASRAVEWLEDTAEALDARYGSPYPCTGDFMCMREQVRHKSGCIGRNEPFNSYIKVLR